MPNLLLVTTEIEAPSVYLVQNRGVDEVIADFKTEALLGNKRGWVYGLTPSPQQHFNTSKLITLNFLRHTDALSTAEHYFRKALYYARINGHQDETELLGKFLTVCMSHYKEAKEKKSVHEGPGKVAESTPPGGETPPAKGSELQLPPTDSGNEPQSSTPGGERQE